MKTIGYLMLAAVVAASVLAQAQTFAQGGNTVIQKGHTAATAANPAVQVGATATTTGSVILPDNLSVITYPGSSGWSGYWGYQGTTVEESFARGLASVIRAKGEYNLATSAAAVNWSVARHREIENNKQWVYAYFELRDLNKAHREAELQRQRGNPADYPRYAHQEAPKPLSNHDLDAVTGKIRWPILLTAADFEQQRAVLEKVFAARAYHGVLGAEDFLAAVRTIDAMSAALSDQVTSVPPQAFSNARTFLRSLAYEARLPAG
jgi:hypothetical protein